MATDSIVIQPKRATATQLVTAGEGPTLIINSDLVNTVFVGNTDSIKATDVSGLVPIAPNGSIAVDGTLDFFGVILNTSTPVTVYTVAGGMSTFLGLTQGGGNLAIPGMQSLNFVSNVSGWQIQQNGNAQFNNLTIRGTFFGLDFIINSSGIFIYSGTPALGNLVGSWAPTGGTDSFGNVYQKDMTVYNAGTTAYVNINSNQAAAGNTGVLFTAPGAIHNTGKTQISGQAVNAGAANEYEILQMTSGIAGAGAQSADITLASTSQDSTIAALIYQTIAGARLTQLSLSQWAISVPISCTLGTPSNPSVITNGGWIRASGFSNGWVNSGGIAGIIYRMTNSNEVEGWMDIQNPVAVGGTSKVFAFVSPYIPTKNFTLQTGWFNAAAAPPIFIDSSTGNFDIVNYSVANVELFGYFKFPLGPLP